MLNTTSFDVIVIGAGPAGLSLARLLAETTLKIAIIDPATASVLKNPPADGREIALTHQSKELLKSWVRGMQCLKVKFLNCAQPKWSMARRHLSCILQPPKQRAANRPIPWVI